MKKGIKIILWILGAILFILLAAIIWFNLPYSPMKNQFEKLVDSQTEKMHFGDEVFTLEDIAELPVPVQKHFQYCGYIGQKKMSNMKIHFRDVDFILSPMENKLKIDYTQFNVADEPVRFAIIDTGIFGIPFEGLDTFIDGQGSMKGVIGKAITIFDEKGESLSRATLVTCLAESLLIPSFATNDFIVWEEIDDTNVKATISYHGISASGIFTFDENGAMKSFTTDDRENVDANGNVQKFRWSAIIEDYKEKDGIKYPTSMKAIWHYDSGDVVYFDGKDFEIEYDYK